MNGPYNFFKYERAIAAKKAVLFIMTGVVFAIVAFALAVIGGAL